jgi:hypothetical protein
MRGLAFVTTSILIVGLSAAPAYADPIAITAGTLTLDRSGGSIQFEGSGGLEYRSQVEGSHFQGTVLQPGDTVPIDTFELGVRGTLTFHGRTFLVNDLAEPSAAAIMEFFGTTDVPAPSFSGAPRVFLTTPFTFTGRFMIPEALYSPGWVLNLTGSGRAEVELRWNANVPAWEPQGGVYRFELSAPAPIPEPATLLLVGSAAAGCLLRRRRRVPLTRTGLV